MAKGSDSDVVRFHRPRFLPGVELVSVRYRERRFPEHSHGEYVVGAVVAGAESLVVRGRAHRVGTGRVLRLEPDEPHANATLGPETLCYHVLYLAADTIAPLLDSAAAGPSLAFATPVGDDSGLFRAVVCAHDVLAGDGSDRLEQEAALALLVRALVRGDPCAAAARTDRLAGASAAVALASAYIDAHYAEGFGLHHLSSLTGLSVFHLGRSFKKAVGLSPLAYRNQCRLIEARRRLLDGEPIAQMALDLGYADQSHLTRHFQRIVGVSPRRYAQQ